ncbi:replication protein A 70 kDa DNA-binding subunit B-like isoform X5 [Oryza brachyantha]|uniref:replication protein A 70 kDa DNA-binding subunit B-like isoform X5 n=1 Tax=Oryza brachyantha TaxID=4533 RepID=UPI0003EADAC0|nr:replication protein A 70 kDa DNA-binding subunit B-like isoform X5 [Oryza brachyantha]XP_040381579.1 replication protein A 70 kDa DNA-binding subunit B-like isoform X5 [Oryza brachyantha]
MFRLSKMQYSLLKDVTQESHSWRVRVQVTRFSEYNSEDQPPVLLRLDLVLLDEEGTMMDAQIPGRHMTSFSPVLKEDRVYYITYFEVAEARASYRPVDNPIMAKFTKHTQIKEINHVPDSFPRYACKVIPFETLQARVDITDVLSDVVGMLTAVSAISTVRIRGGHKEVRNIQITDGRETISVSLWGPHARQFDAEGLQAEANMHPVIMLFVAVTSKICEQQLTLYGSTICRWYSNAMIPEVVALQQSLTAKPHGVTWFGQTVTKKQHSNVTVPDIAGLNPHDILGNTYVLNIAIKGIIPGDNWWYIACQKCKRTAAQEGSFYKCIKCGVTQPETRFVNPSCL